MYCMYHLPLTFALIEISVTHVRESTNTVTHCVSGAVYESQTHLSR